MSPSDVITCEDGRKLANESIVFNLMYYVIVTKKLSRAMVLLYFKLFDYYHSATSDSL